MAKAPEPQGLTVEEQRQIERRVFIGALICWSPLFAYLFLALLNGWPV